MLGKSHVNVISTLLLLTASTLDYILPFGYSHSLLYVLVAFTLSNSWNTTERRRYIFCCVILIAAGSFWSGGKFVSVLPAIDVLGRFSAIATVLMINVIAEGRNHSLPILEPDNEVYDFKRFINTFPILAWTATVEGKVDYVSDSFLHFTGVNREELLNNGWRSVVHADDFCLVERQWHKALLLSKEYRVEARIRNTSGGYGWFLMQAKAVRSGQGSIHKWIGSCINISELKLLQNEQARQVEKYYSTLNRIVDGVITVDSQLVVTYVNERACEMLAVTASEIMNRPLSDHLEFLYDVLADKLAVVLTTQSEHSLSFSHEPSENLVDIRICPIPEGVALFIQDINQQRELQFQLNRNQRIEAIGQLTGGVAHDFNNLLTVIMGNADLLRKVIERDASYMLPHLHQSIKLIEDAGERGKRLTASLLAYSRRQNLDVELVEVGSLVQEIEDLMVSSLGNENQLFISQSKGKQWVTVDPGQLESALLNLVINARDAMNKDGRLHIHIKDELVSHEHYAPHKLVAGNYVTIKVADNGSGIPDKYLTRIFDPFFSTKNIDKGTGLGLSSVFGFTRQSGGDIQVESKVNFGTTFTLYLPKADPPDHGGNDVAEITSQSPSLQDSVLLVEDDRLVRDYATMVLENYGYKVTAAINGDAAIEQLKTGATYDVVFSDIVMPGEANGFDVARYAQSIKPHQPVLLTSGFMGDELGHKNVEEPQLEELQANMLVKPYQADELLFHLQKALLTYSNK